MVIVAILPRKPADKPDIFIYLPHGISQTEDHAKCSKKAVTHSRHKSSRTHRPFNGDKLLLEGNLKTEGGLFIDIKAIAYTSSECAAIAATR